MHVRVHRGPFECSLKNALILQDAAAAAALLLRAASASFVPSIDGTNLRRVLLQFDNADDDSGSGSDDHSGCNSIIQWRLPLIRERAKQQQRRRRHTHTQRSAAVAAACLHDDSGSGSGQSRRFRLLCAQFYSLRVMDAQLFISISNIPGQRQTDTTRIDYKIVFFHILNQLAG